MCYLKPDRDHARRKAMTKISKRTTLLVAATVIGSTFMPSLSRARTPEPPFTSVVRDGAFELRDYAPQVVAEVTVRAQTGGNAANRGFNPLAGYIFGGNQPRAKIAMTAPVTRQQGAKIAMTAPVTQQNAGSDSWKVRFIMPAGSRLETMPVPNDPNVRLLGEPARRYAVLRFSGSGGEATFATKASELTAVMAQRRLTAISAPVFAQYDPPWTLPFMRRNEVWIEVARPN
jgi:hypothetical protein